MNEEQDCTKGDSNVRNDLIKIMYFIDLQSN